MAPIETQTENFLSEQNKIESEIILRNLWSLRFTFITSAFQSEAFKYVYAVYAIVSHSLPNTAVSFHPFPFCHDSVLSAPVSVQIED